MQLTKRQLATTLGGFAEALKKKGYLGGSLSVSLRTDGKYDVVGYLIDSFGHVHAPVVNGKMVHALPPKEKE